MGNKTLDPAPEAQSAFGLNHGSTSARALSGLTRESRSPSRPEVALGAHWDIGASGYLSRVPSRFARRYKAMLVAAGYLDI